MGDVQIQRPTDTWVIASWGEYMRAIEDPTYEKAKS
jgi:hypothetical protein